MTVVRAPTTPCERSQLTVLGRFTRVHRFRSTVTYWNGLTWVPVTGQRVSYATSSDQPTTISFDPVGTTAVRLDMTSRSPNDPATGNLTIAEITIPGDEVVPHP